jgi:hypothetical protein
MDASSQSMTTKEIVLSTCQQKAYDMLTLHYNSDDNLINLVGPAGCGKTFLLSYWCNHQSSLRETVFLSPTHRAKEVLIKCLPKEAHVMTTDSFLGLRMTVNPFTLETEFRPIGDWTHNPDNKKWEYIEDNDNKQEEIIKWDTIKVVIQDESSMLSKESSDKGMLLINQCIQHNVKLILSGDDLQLPPINGQWMFPLRVLNNKRIQVIHMTTQLRSSKNDLQDSFNILRKAVKNNGKGFKLVPTDNIKPISYKNILKCDFKRTRILAHTNKRVAYHNNIILQHIRRQQGISKNILLYPGDLVLTMEAIPTNRPNDMLNNGHEFIIYDVQNTAFNLSKDMQREFPEFKDIHVPCYKIFTSPTTWIICAKRNSTHYLKFQSKINDVKREIKNNPNNLKSILKLYSELSSINGRIVHSFAQTVYKSQGSTYPRVIVDTQDIFEYGGDTTWRLLYVAFSRASHKINIIRKIE